MLKEITGKWLSTWLYILMIILGIPTIGFTWCVGAAWGSDDPWQIRLCQALESWLHNLRKLGLFLGGFLTLGYTWFLFDKFGEPFFLGIRMKYSK